MERHPLIQPMRAFLLGLLGLAMAPYWPEMGMTCLVAGFGWWSGCGCCGPTCFACTAGTVSDQYQAVIAGTTRSGTCTAPDCNQLNSTFVLDRQADTGGWCFWSYALPPIACGYNYLVMGANLSIKRIQIRPDYAPPDLSGSPRVTHNIAGGGVSNCAWSAHSCAFAEQSFGANHCFPGTITLDAL